MKLPLLFNPKAGTAPKDIDALLGRLSKEYRDRIDPIIFEAPWNFEPHIDQAISSGGPLFVWGGDGTIHHAGRALVEAGCPVPLAAVPGGSGNGLVRGLRTPLDPAGAIARLLEGRELRMDLPRLDGIPFLNVCGTGFEGLIAHAFENVHGRGLLTYARLCLRLWRKHPECVLNWEVVQAPPRIPGSRMEKLKAAWEGDDPEPPGKVWSLCFANLPQYGSGLWIAPGADPTDGVIQWVALKRPTLFDLPFGMPPLFREGGRTHLRQEGRVLQCVVHLEEPLPWHMDGEPAVPRDCAELALERGAFRMQVTESCPWK